MARYRLTESRLRGMIREAVQSALNEVGDTPEGQRRLGALHARKVLRNNDFSKAPFEIPEIQGVHDYAAKARGGDTYDRYGNNDNPMYDDYARGYMDYLYAHPEEYFDNQRRREESEWEDSLD